MRYTRTLLRTYIRRYLLFLILFNTFVHIGLILFPVHRPVKLDRKQNFDLVWVLFCLEPDFDHHECCSALRAIYMFCMGKTYLPLKLQIRISIWGHFAHWKFCFRSDFDGGAPGIKRDPNIRTFDSFHSIYIRSFVSTNEGTFVYLRFIRLLIGRELDHLQKS